MKWISLQPPVLEAGLTELGVIGDIGDSVDGTKTLQRGVRTDTPGPLQSAIAIGYELTSEHAQKEVSELGIRPGVWTGERSEIAAAELPGLENSPRPNIVSSSSSGSYDRTALLIEGVNSEPVTAAAVEQNEQKAIMMTMAKYIRKIEELQATVSDLKLQNRRQSAQFHRRSSDSFGGSSGNLLGEAEQQVLLDADSNADIAVMDGDLSSTVARVIAQTQEQLRVEELLLQQGLQGKVSEEVGLVFQADGGADGDLDRRVLDTFSEGGAETAQQEKEFQERQKIMAADIASLTKSIQLKEQFVEQLQKNRNQYEAMKSFYERKLESLEREMSAKQAERDRLMLELESLHKNNNLGDNNSSEKNRGKEEQLRALLKKKDEELKSLNQRQLELNHMTSMRSRYADQMAKLETEIGLMKRQRVDLTKGLQLEKKNHMLALSQKMLEIERLKKDLGKRTLEMKKLEHLQQRTEGRMKDALREGAMFRKKATDLMRLASTDPISLRTRATRQLSSKAHSSAESSQRSRLLSKDQMVTKNWIDKRLDDIVAREQAIAALQVNCSYAFFLLFINILPLNFCHSIHRLIADSTLNCCKRKKRLVDSWRN